MAEPLQLQLPDGRSLAYSLFGAPYGGVTLVWLHGTPSGSRPPTSIETAAKDRGVRIIAPSRPGYGGSTRSPGRRVVDVVADIQALNEHLGVKQCIVMGWSGGGR